MNGEKIDGPRGHEAKPASNVSFGPIPGACALLRRICQAQKRSAGAVEPVLEWVSASQFLEARMLQPMGRPRRE